MKLRFEAIFAQVFDNEVFTKLKVKIHKRHYQYFETDKC